MWPIPVLPNLRQSVEDKIDEYQWQIRAFLQNTRTDPSTGWDMIHGQPVLTPGGQGGTVPNTMQPGEQQNGQRPDRQHDDGQQ